MFTIFRCLAAQPAFHALLSCPGILSKDKVTDKDVPASRYFLYWSSIHWSVKMPPNPTSQANYKVSLKREPETTIYRKTRKWDCQCIIFGTPILHSPPLFVRIVSQMVLVTIIRTIRTRKESYLLAFGLSMN